MRSKKLVGVTMAYKPVEIVDPAGNAGKYKADLDVPYSLVRGFMGGLIFVGVASSYCFKQELSAISSSSVHSPVVLERKAGWPCSGDSALDFRGKNTAFTQASS